MMAFFSDAFLTVEMQWLAFEEIFYDGAILFLLPAQSDIDCSDRSITLYFVEFDFFTKSCYVLIPEASFSW